MSWFDDLLNMQWWKDGVPLPRRQVVDVTFTGLQNGGDLIDDSVNDRTKLFMPPYRPQWPFPLTAAPAVNAIRYVRPFRDTYDTTPIVSQTFVVPKTFTPDYIGWDCFGVALATDSITFTAMKNGVATALAITIAAGSPGGLADQFSANSTGVTWNKGDTLGLQVLQSGATAQASWHALVTIQ